ncbi:MAG TPA: hypothetical protein VME92_22985 [Acetobacteraceae bacterium]|nr:hypothetical protein [Acetobacteraceae bacterium]
MDAARPEARIIPFPTPRAARPDATARAQAAANAADQRLAEALAALHQALARQQQAVGDWRRNLTALHTQTERLAGSLHEYRSRLDDVKAGLGRLHGEAKRLEAWADATLAQEAAETAG